MRSLWLVGFLACARPTSELGPVTTGTTMDGTSTTAPVITSAPGAPTSDGTTASNGTAASTGTTTSPTTAGDVAGDSSGAHFIIEPDSEGGGNECDVFAQDCPPGQKCAWTALEGGSYWDVTTCVPLARDPLPDGAPCTYDLDAAFDGIDECGPAAMCVEAYFEPGDWDGQATCQSLCKGSGEYPYCDPGMICVGGRTLWLCMPICDPLAQDCPVGQRCDLYGPATLCTWDWPDEPRVEIGEPCDVAQQCDLGSTCLQAATPACARSSCCTPFCDLADPQAKCPIPGQKCLAPYDWGQLDQPSLGVCRTETP